MGKSFSSSQAAHSRLIKHHEQKMHDPKKYDVAFTKRSYHVLCFNRQKTLGRQLSDSEKKKAYSDVISTFY